MASLFYNKETENIQAFYSISRYLDDLLNIDNPYFEGMVGRIYPLELQLNKINVTDTEVPFLGFAFIFFKRMFSSKIYYERNDFDFDKVKFPFLRGTFPVQPLTEFTFLCLFDLLECLVLSYSNARNKILTAKHLQQGYRYHKL